jgi:hypothetical protein
MALLRFAIQLVVFIGVLASTAVVVLVLMLIMRYPPALIVISITCLIFYGVHRRLPTMG